MMPDLPEQQPSGASAFAVLINHEEQYALWPADKPVPDKWRHSGMTGSREDCLAFVRREWTDMRPLRVRKRQDEASRDR